jgi:O-antigen/teichoic acid export membrane protein
VVPQVRLLEGRWVASATGRLAPLTRLGWGVADQGVSSLGNFAFSILLAKALSPNDFGAFTIAWVTYGMILNASRGLATDALVVRFSHTDTASWREAVRASSGTALAVGVAAGVLCVGAGLVLPDPVGTGILVLGLVLPGLLLQDAWRFASFAAGRPALAFVNDLVWGVLQTAAAAALLVTGQATVGTASLAFGGTAAVAALVGWFQLRVAPHVGKVRHWYVTQRSLSVRYAIENTSISGARQLRMSLLGVVAGLAAVGQVRAAEILMGPFMVILMGVAQVAVPEGVRVLQRSPHRLLRFSLLLGSVQALAACTWGVLMFLLVPRGLGELLLGDLWVGAYALLLPVLVNMAVGCFENGAQTGVRALGASRHSLAAQLSNAALYLVGGVGGAVLDGARGSCWGVAAATTIATVIWWRRLFRALREHQAGSGGVTVHPPPPSPPHPSPMTVKETQ